MTIKSILIPISEFGASGGYRVLSELANHWVDSGCRVDFLVNEHGALPYFPTVAGIRIYGAKGIPLDAGQVQNPTVKGTKKRALDGWIGMLRALSRIGHEYDIVLANHSLTAIPVALSRVGRARKFYYVQAYEPEYYDFRTGLKSKVLRALSAMSYLLPLRQIANAPVYIGYKSIRAHRWIPPGVDENVFCRRAYSPKFEAGRPWTVGTIGRLEPYKGTKYVLEAFELLAASDSGVRLKVAFGNLPAGWGHNRATVVVPHSDGELADFYRSVDVLIAPGIVQLGACHYPVLEAMACGTPVVTTGYFPADSENAWIVPICDSAAIADEVKNIRQMSEHDLVKRLDRAAAEIRAFYWPNVARQFLAEFADGRG